MASDTIYTYLGKATAAPEELPEDDTVGTQTDALPSLPGVPARDLTQADVKGLPKWLQKAVAMSPLYRAVTPRADKADAKAEPKKD